MEEEVVEAARCPDTDDEQESFLPPREIGDQLEGGGEE